MVSPFRLPNVNPALYRAAENPTLMVYVKLKHWNTGKIITRRVIARTPKGAAWSIYFKHHENFKEYIIIGMNFVPLTDWKRKEAYRKQQAHEYLKIKSLFDNYNNDTPSEAELNTDFSTQNSDI